MAEYHFLVAWLRHSTFSLASLAESRHSFNWRSMGSGRGPAAAGSAPPRKRDKRMPRIPFFISRSSEVKVRRKASAAMLGGHVPEDLSGIGAAGPVPRLEHRALQEPVRQLGQELGHVP